MIFVAGFTFFNFLPALFFIIGLDLGAVSLEMAMLVTMPALEWELLVIQFFVMMPVPYF